MAWSAFGVVPFSRHEVCDWWRLFGVPVFGWCWRVSWGDQRSLFQTEGASPVWCWISFSSFGRRQATGLPRTTSWGTRGRTGFTTTWFSTRVGSTSSSEGRGVSTAHCRWSWWHGRRCRWDRWRSWAHDDRQGRWGFRRGRIWGGRRGCVVEQPYSSNTSWCVEHVLFERVWLCFPRGWGKWWFLCRGIWRSESSSRHPWTLFWWAHWSCSGLWAGETGNENWGTAAWTTEGRALPCRTWGPGTC